MTFPVWAGEWGTAPHRAPGRQRTLSRWQAHRWSRRFAGVGVTITAARLRELATGNTATADELTNVSFALTATEIERQQRRASLREARFSVVQLLFFVVMALVALNVLMCLAYVLLSEVS